MYLKKLTFPALTVALIALFSVGCKKSSNSGNSSTPISAHMGSASFSTATSSTFAWYSTDSAVYTISGFSISGHDTTGLNITLFPPYALNMQINPGSVYMDYYVSSSKDYFGGGGDGHIELTVTSQDTVAHKIAGTFTATLYNTFDSSDSVQVTNGQFNTPYIIQP